MELAERIAGKLSSAQRKIWQAKGPYGANQPLGEGVVHFCIRILTLRGIVCFALRSENKAPLPPVDPARRIRRPPSVDLGALRSPPEARGVRLLPPRDPDTQLRDRETIVDKQHHREVWKTAGEPGTVLADGRIVGIWRPRKSGRTLTLTVTTFRSLSTKVRKLRQEEADQVAELRGAATVQVEFGDA